MYIKAKSEIEKNYSKHLISLCLPLFLLILIVGISNILTSMLIINADGQTLMNTIPINSLCLTYVSPFNVFCLLSSFVVAFSIRLCILKSKTFDNEIQTSKYIFIGIIACLLIYIINLLLSCCFSGLYIKSLYNDTYDVTDSLISYVRLSGIFSIFMITFIFLTVLLDIIGEYKSLLISSIIFAVINNLLVLLFLYGFKLSINWSIYAFVISSFITMIYELYCIIKSKLINIKIKFKDILPNKNDIYNVFKLSIYPIIISVVSSILMYLFILLFKLSETYNYYLVGSFAIIIKYVELGVALGVTYHFAVKSLLDFNFRFKRFKKSFLLIKVSLIIAALIGFIYFIIVASLSIPLANIYGLRYYDLFTITLYGKAIRNTILLMIPLFIFLSIIAIYKSLGMKKIVISHVIIIIIFIFGLAISFNLTKEPFNLTWLSFAIALLVVDIISLLISIPYFKYKIVKKKLKTE